MAAVRFRYDLKDFKKIDDRLRKLTNRTRYMRPAMEAAAGYMVNATVNRILRTKTSPGGQRWQALSALTQELKGHDAPLFETGGLARSIRVYNLTNSGFEIGSPLKYAGPMQKGVRKVRGKYRSNRPRPQVPPRPFLGFSPENKRRIAKILKDHVLS